jgi:hypothetical protein
MQSRIERRTDSNSPASAVSPSGRYSILPSRDRESSGKRYSLIDIASSLIAAIAKMTRPGQRARVVRDGRSGRWWKSISPD